MSTMTAQFIAGGEDLWHGGIRPLDQIWLSEGISTSLVLGLPEDPGSLAWETAPGQIYEDAMLMLALRAVADPELRALARTEASFLLADGPLRRERTDQDLAGNLTTRAVDLVAASAKLVVTILAGSALGPELDRLALHPGPIEICIPRGSTRRPGRIRLGCGDANQAQTP